MTLTVLLFASYADALGRSTLELDLPSGTTVEGLLERVRGMAPATALPHALVAVNQAYAAPGQLVAPGDEIAIIPPVAGG
jgi:molybdopterin converting factor subunit 1